MRSQVLLLVLSCFTLASCGDVVIRGEGSLIKVQSDCSKTRNGVTTITLYADQPVVVNFVCKGGVVVSPKTRDGVTYVQTAAFVPGAGPVCLFEKMARAQVYKLKVEVARGKKGGTFVVNDDNIFLVTCKYDSESKNSTTKEYIDLGHYIFEEIFKNSGSRLKSIPVELAAVDVIGKPVKDASLGRIVKLRAKVKGSLRLRPVSCVAFNGVKEYRILLGGCGDGIVFRKTSGFKVRGRIIDSPFFVAFRLQGSVHMGFKCNFTVCHNAAKCDGNSCYKKNRKRPKRTALYPLQTGPEYEEQEEEMFPVTAVMSPITIKPSSNRRRRRTCRRHVHAFLSRRPPCPSALP
ncbi:vitelline envelope sperm lysin receptor-like [Haliotis rubra]|uniref:vitelline envelope sperm lysin receptor-like n=1 Tax=Haliotis rubra TaxID=36100 RepID=UPI001EE53AF7|nr:vitelline envelope sperm lysin receptor-like [Haliotis rubra]